MSGTDSERKRGRPAGTGAHQITDIPLLQRVADLKLAQTSEKTTTLIKRVVPARDTGGIRRLQRKFKEDEFALMADAQARLRASQVGEVMAVIGMAMMGLNELRRRFVNFLGSPDGERLIEGVQRMNQAWKQFATVQELQRLHGPEVHHPTA